MRKWINIILLLMISTCVHSQGNTPCTASSLSVSSGLCSSYTPGTTVGSTYQNNAANGGTPTCAFPGAPDSWYSFVAPAGGSITITTTAGTITDSGIQIFSSSTNLCTGVLTSIGCDDDSGPGLMSEITLTGLIPGNTYFIRIWQYGGSGTGTFNICVYAPAPPSTNQDCSTATQVCSNSPFSGNSNGFATQELNVSNQGCLTIEHQSSWYILQIQTSGTLQMTISPGAGVDYDFAMWGPNPSCPPSTAPIRCSYDAGTGNTGINSTNNAPQTDVSEGVFGNSWVQDMNVVAGQIYILLIDNFTANSTPFNLNWGGTASLNCTPLPIELLEFTGINIGQINKLSWVTATETNNDLFTVERSSNGYTWEEIGTVDGSGNSSQAIRYSFVDSSPNSGINYYRLKQTDFDGRFEYFNIIAIDNSKSNDIRKITIYDVFGKEYNKEDNLSPGMYIYHIEYKNNTVEIKKVIKQ